MANTMCAVKTKYGAFTDYFLHPTLVIRLLENIAESAVDERTQQLDIPWINFIVFLRMSDHAAVVRAQEAHLTLLTARTEAEREQGNATGEWGTVNDFLTWFRNMQAMLENGEFNPFIEGVGPARYVTFDFS